MRLALNTVIKFSIISGDGGEKGLPNICELSRRALFTTHKNGNTVQIAQKNKNIYFMTVADLPSTKAVCISRVLAWFFKTSLPYVNRKLQFFRSIF